MSRRLLLLPAVLATLWLTTLAEASCNAHYTVVAGDTCSSIVSSKHTYMAEVLALNAATINADCSNLSVGESICWRDSTDPSCATKLSIPSGSSCSSVAAANSATVAEILAWNPYLNSGCSNLYAGDYLCVSGNALTTTITTKATSTTASASPTATKACTGTYTVQSGDTCGNIETTYSLTSAQFYGLNPSVNVGCSNLAIGQVLCVQGTYATMSSTATASATIAGLCTKQYIIRSGDTCSSIASAAGITSAQLMSANAQINSACTNLIVGEALCLSVSTVTSTTTTPSPTSTNPSCAIAYQVVSGDTCTSITATFGMTTTDLLSLNPQVNSNCTNLAVGNVLCIELKAATTTSSAAPSSALSCITTYTVVSGDTCSSIWTAASLSSTQFYSLNPTVNANCTNLQLGELLCIKAQATATATSIGPTPTTYGCYQTYVVKPGDTLSAITISTGIYQAQLIGINPGLQSSTSLSVGQILCIRDNTCPACSQTYTVRTGDSCSSIAANHALSTSTFTTLNPYINAQCSNIFVGDDVCISPGTLTATATYPLTSQTASATPLPTGTCNQEYTVQTGDTCSQIVVQNGIYLAQLYGLNPSINTQCTNIKVGQSLCLSSSSVPPCASRALVQMYQTCTSIAQTSNMNVTQLLSLNPFIDTGCSNIITGDNICVLSGASVCNSTMVATSSTTCSSIQVSYKIPTDAFSVCNPTLQCSESITGASVCTSCTGSQPTCNKVATASSGATCASMATSLNITSSLFQYWNQQTDCTFPLSTSNYYCVSSVQSTTPATSPPPPLPKPTCSATYTWKSTDTCASVSQSNLRTTDSIEACNTAVNCTSGTIATGTSLCTTCQYTQPTCAQVTKSTTGSTWGSFITSLGLTSGQFQACNPLVTLNTSSVMPSNRYYCSNCSYISSGDCMSNYTVSSGDTCSNIVTQNNLYLAQLETNNPTLNCTTLQVGQKLCMQALYDPTCWKSTVVATGQTCASIAIANNVTMENILQLNPDLDTSCDNLFPGDTICVQGFVIPDLSPPVVVPKCTANYTVVSGDSCITIAQTFDTYVAQIVGLNPSLNTQCTNIAVGQVLCTDRSDVPVCKKTATIASGDTCSTVATANNVTTGVTGITAYNPFLSAACNNIFPGDTLCVDAPNVVVNVTTPVTPTTPTAPWTIPPATVSCALKYTALASDNCTTVAAAYNISTLTLLRYNQGLYNCSDIAGQSLCVIPDVQGCTNTYVVTKQNTTCEYIQNRYGLSNDTFTMVNPGINCNGSLPISSTACIDNVFTDCTHNYTSVAGDTCTTVQSQFGLATNIFSDINPNLSCSGTLAVGTNVCVGSTFAQCSQVYSSALGDTCAILAEEYFRNSTAALSNLNPNVNCSQVIPINTRLCLQSNQEVGCGDVYNVQSGDTCTSVESAFKLTSDVLNVLNPGLICTALNPGQKLCVAAAAPTCKSNIISNGYDTCASIQATYNVTATNFYLYNPQLDCSAGNIAIGESVCISASQLKLPSQQLMSEAVNKFGSLSPQLQTLYQAMQANPTTTTETQFVDAMISTLSTSSALTLLQNLTATDPFFMALEATGASQRSEFCTFTNGNTFFTTSNSCFCGNSLPLIYCNAIYTQEIDTATANPAFSKRSISKREFQEGVLQKFQEKYPEFAEERRRLLKREEARKKRHPLDKRLLNIKQWCDPTNLKNVIDEVGGANPEPNNDGEVSQTDYCSSDSCVWPITDFFEVRIAEEWCIQSAHVNGTGVVQEVQDNYESIQIELCLSDPAIDDILNIFDIPPPCLDIQGRYWNNRGVLQLDAEINIIVTIEGSLIIKLMPSDDDLCQGSDFCANDFCFIDMWQHYEEIHIWITILWWTKDIYGPKEMNLPICNPADAASTLKPPSSPYGKGISPEMGKMITHINYAFSMVSYSPEMDTYYLDPTDLFADTGACSGMSLAQCTWSTISSFFFSNSNTDNCMQIPSSYQCAPGVISMVPYFGYKESDGSCPVTTCYNEGGPEGGRNPPCTTQLDGTTLKESPDESTILACGQFSYLLDLMHLQDSALDGVRVILSIGGWYDANYFTPATDPTHVENFVQSIVSILDFFPFDGIDIDWEYPGFEHGDEPLYQETAYGDRENTQNCVTSICEDAARSNDPAQYVNFLTMLRTALNTAGPTKLGRNKHGDMYELSIAAPSGYDKYKLLDMNAICSVVTHVNLMTYDMHGAWDPITNHQAPIYDNTPGAVGEQYSIDDAVTGWIKAGCDPSRLVLGVPFYSRTEVGVEPGQAYGSSQYPGLYQPFTGAQMDATSMPTFAQIVNDPSWTTYWDPYSQASWAWNPSMNYFASYDSEKALVNKMCYAGAKGLAGAMVWLLGQDTEDNRALAAVYNNLTCTTMPPIISSPPPTVETQPGEACPDGLTKRQATGCQAYTARKTVIHMVQVGRGESFVIEAQNWQNTFATGTNAENMMYASNNGGVLVGTKGIMIDTGNGYPQQLQYLQAVIANMAISKKAQPSFFDTVILTHSDTDHIRGLVRMFEQNTLSANGIPYFRPSSKVKNSVNYGVSDPGTAFMHDSPFDLSLRYALNVPIDVNNDLCLDIQLFCESSYDADGLQLFQDAVDNMRTEDYSMLLGELSQLATNNGGTWVSAYGQTSGGNQGAGGSPYFGYNGIGMLMSANNLDISGSLFSAFSMPYMCGTGRLTNPVSYPAWNDGQTDVSETMDLDEDLPDDVMGGVQQQLMKQPNSNAGAASNMVSTITEMTTGSTQMLFTGDMNELEWQYVSQLRAAWPMYTILKVPHHCSKLQMINLYSSIVANVYLISGKTEGNTFQPAGSCLQDIIINRLSNPNAGIGHIFVTNWSTGKNDLDATLATLDAVAKKYRIYVLNSGVTDGTFQVSDYGDVVIDTAQWTDKTPNLPTKFDKVIAGNLPQTGESGSYVGQLAFS